MVKSLSLVPYLLLVGIHMSGSFGVCGQFWYKVWECYNN